MSEQASKREQVDEDETDDGGSSADGQDTLLRSSQFLALVDALQRNWKQLALMGIELSRLNTEYVKAYLDLMDPRMIYESTLFTDTAPLCAALANLMKRMGEYENVLGQYGSSCIQP
jgi:hypothetical protein